MITAGTWLCSEIIEQRLHSTLYADGTQTLLLTLLLFPPSFLIGIRQLQLILFKVALMLGVEIHVNVEFVKVLEPPEDQENQSTVYFSIHL